MAITCAVPSADKWAHPEHGLNGSPASPSSGQNLGNAQVPSLESNKHSGGEGSPAHRMRSPQGLSAGGGGSGGGGAGRSSSQGLAPAGKAGGGLLQVGAPSFPSGASPSAVDESALLHCLLEGGAGLGALDKDPNVRPPQKFGPRGESSSSVVLLQRLLGLACPLISTHRRGW